MCFAVGFQPTSRPTTDILVGRFDVVNKLRHARNANVLGRVHDSVRAGYTSIERKKTGREKREMANGTRERGEGVEKRGDPEERKRQKEKEKGRLFQLLLSA